jgi:hypothetical protein
MEIGNEDAAVLAKLKRARFCVHQTLRDSE